MAIVQALIALLARSAGRLLNTVFGWATVMLFGKVPDDRQIYLSIMAFGSVAWLAVAIGIAFPAVGVFLLAFVPLPDWVNDNWVRLIMLGLALLIPPLVGLLSIKMLDEEQRPKSARDKAMAVLKGYPYTCGLALTLVMMTLFAPFLMLHALVRRWKTDHVPVIVEATDYMHLVGEIETALAAADWKTERRRASWMLRLPTKTLTALAGGAIEKMVADQLTTLASDKLEVTLHPSDLVISGAQQDVAHVRAVLAEQLAFSDAYFTWSKEANEIEDRMQAVWGELQRGIMRFTPEDVVARIQEIDRDLRQLKVPYEEWEVLFRQKLLLERGMLQVATGVTERPQDLADRLAA